MKLCKKVVSRSKVSFLFFSPQKLHLSCLESNSSFIRFCKQVHVLFRPGPVQEGKSLFNGSSFVFCQKLCLSFLNEIHVFKASSGFVKQIYNCLSFGVLSNLFIFPSGTCCFYLIFFSYLTHFWGQGVGARSTLLARLG